MDSTEKGQGGEIRMSDNITSEAEVSITIPSGETQKAGIDTKSKDPEMQTTGFVNLVTTSCPSPEISYVSSSPSKPPITPTNEEKLTRRTITRSVYSKPRVSSSIASEIRPNSPYKESSTSGSVNLVAMSCPSPEISYVSSSPNKPPIIPTNEEKFTRRTITRSVHSKPCGSSSIASFKDSAEDEEHERESFKETRHIKYKHWRVRIKSVIELVAVLCILGCLVASLTVEKWEKTMIWGLELWKWCVLVMVTLCGMVVISWFMNLVVFLIKMNWMLRNKLLYYVNGLKMNIQVFVWMVSVLVAWAFLFVHGVKQSKTAIKVVDYVTRTLISLILGSFLWLLKSLWLKIIASRVHVKAFFDKITESIFDQYVLQTLSGPPLIQEAELVGRSISMGGVVRFRSTKSGKGINDQMIDVRKLNKAKAQKFSARNMKLLVDIVKNSGVSTICDILDENLYEEGGESSDKEITNEMEATAAAYYIFMNVAKPGFEYIDEEDLSRFMIKEEVDLVFPRFEGAETGRIDRKALTDWVVKIYYNRKALAGALKDTDTVVEQLNKLMTGILVFVIINIWLLIMEISSSQVLISQLLGAAFIFGNTCKNMFEGIIFVLAVHPFDVGDRCVVDDLVLLVEEVNIFTTVFLKVDNEKVYYPNSVLATKPISNYNRSPDMGDAVEFSIDISTPAEKIGLLQQKIKKYLEHNCQYWQRNQSVVVKEIEADGKLKMAVHCFYTMNFQNLTEKNKRRSELIIEMKKIFEELGMVVHLPS